MGESADPLEELLLEVGAGRVSRPASRRAWSRVAAASQDVAELEAGLTQEWSRESWSPYERSSATICAHRVAICDFEVLQDDLLRLLVQTIWQPDGRNGKSSFDRPSRDACRGIAGERAELRAKRNSLRWWPTKSSTVRTALSRVGASPRPSCCRKIVALSVGRRNSTVSTSGTSRPSLKRSTVKRTFTSPRSRSPERVAGRLAGVSPADRASRDTGFVEDLRPCTRRGRRSRRSPAHASRRRRRSCRGPAEDDARRARRCRCRRRQVAPRRTVHEST